MTDDDSDSPDGVDPDPEKAAFLREIADEIREETAQSEQVSAFVYRVSDLYDEDEETSPGEIYRNMRNILNVKEHGGLKR